MKTVQVGEFKADFSSIIDKVQNLGETFIIEYGKKHKKVAMLVPYEENIKPRVFGQLQGKYDVPDDFDNELKDINDMFYGKED